MPRAEWRLSLCGGITLALCAAAMAMGIAFLSIPGLQYDEILFLHPFLNDWALYHSQYFGQEIPLMVMSYVGALKTWLYWPLYTWLPPSVWVVRLPMLLVGCLNIWMLYRLGRRLWSPRAGVVAAAFAATDPTFLLTQVFDWGPVALQVSLSLAAALAFLRWRDTNTAGWLALCGFCCGLALWNKAIFVWVVIALVVATLLCWPGRFFSHYIARHPSRHWRAAAYAALAFGVGCAPFLAYNMSQQASTLKENVLFEKSFPTHKLSAMASSLNGNRIASSVGFSAVWQGKCTDGSLQSLSGRTPIPDRLRWLPESTLTPSALAAAAVFLLWRWRTASARIGIWLLVAFLIHCGLAIMSVHGGTGLHHYAPSLPMVFLTIGGAWDLGFTLSRQDGRRIVRRVLLALAVFVPVYAAATLLGWWQRADYCGSQDIWSDASATLAAHVVAHPNQRFYATDWGIDPQVIYLSEKHGNIRFLGFLIDPPAEAGPQYEQAAEILANANSRLVSFRPGAEVITSHHERLEAVLQIHGYRLVHEEWITDSRNRRVYAIWRAETKQ